MDHPDGGEAGLNDLSPAAKIRSYITECVEADCMDNDELFNDKPRKVGGLNTALKMNHCFPQNILRPKEQRVSWKETF